MASNVGMMVTFVPRFGNPALQPETFYASDHLKILCHNPKADRAVVVFDHRRVRDGEFAQINPSAKITGAGFSYITVASRLNDWFLSPSLAESKAKISALMSRYQRVVGFGSSMGGYGVLAMARAFRFNQVLLVSPQFTVFPSQPPFDQRFSQQATKLDPSFDTVAQNPRKGLGGVIVFDPAIAQDRQHARLICRSFPRLRTVAMPFAGHPALKLITQSANFSRIQDELIAPRVSPYRITQIHRELRADSIEYNTALREYLKTRESRQKSDG